MFNDDEFLNALLEMNSSHFDKKTWLIHNFELYKQTLNWPKKFPPINRSDLILGSLRERFNSIYFDTLSELKYNLNNDKQTLELEQPF
jgi:hypothetical protein